MGIEMREMILKEFPVERGKILTWKYFMPYEGHDQPIIVYDKRICQNGWFKNGYLARGELETG
jgi:hypothetical protein